MNEVVLCFDTETTGRVEPEVIEAAWVRLVAPSSLVPIERFYARYRPTKPIELGAMATHHIMDEDLADCPPCGTFSLPVDTAYLIGHKVDYDWEVAGKPNVRRICTLALAQKIWPEADSHTLSSLMYLLERERARDLIQNAHAADADVDNCVRVLGHIITRLGVTDWETLWRHSESARVPEIMPFGKHKGDRIDSIPPDYKRWLLGQPDVDPYLVMALKGERPAAVPAPAIKTKP